MFMASFFSLVKVDYFLDSVLLFQSTPDMPPAQHVKAEMQYQAIRLISLLVAMDEKWLADQVTVVSI